LADLYREKLSLLGGGFKVAPENLVRRAVRRKIWYAPLDVGPRKMKIHRGHRPQ